jgi:hypothetical protein
VTRARGWLQAVLSAFEATVAFVGGLRASLLSAREETLKRAKAALAEAQVCVCANATTRMVPHRLARVLVAEQAVAGSSGTRRRSR